MALPNGLPQVSDIESVLSGASIDAFQRPEEISAPFTSIRDIYGNPRKLPDPSKTLKSVMAKERIVFRLGDKLTHEVGLNGEPVACNRDRDPRIRFVGNWISLLDTQGERVNTVNSTDYIEITFYGTGLNILQYPDSGTSSRFAYTVDGGASANVTSAGQSVILTARNYNSNTVSFVTSGLTPGVHTIRLSAALSGGGALFGVEIINEAAQISTTSGSILANGFRYTNAALSSTSFNAGFDGSPVLNGRGGKVVQYITPNGTLGKVLQQTDASSLFLASTNHANEELIRKINFREFGAHRTDDFSTLADTVDNVYFTLKDGTTTLVGRGVRVFTSGGTLADAPGVYVNTSGAAGGLWLTFVGTGLDLITNFGNSAETITIFVDGVSVGTVPYTNNARNKLIKIASGLPYGTHTVRLERGGGLSDFMNVSDFMIYGPKTPEIPDGTQKVCEYYLMANYDGSAAGGSTNADMLRIPQGTLFKSSHREWTYEGAGYSFVDNFAANVRTGFVVATTSNTAPKTFYFWGTGFVLEGTTNTGGAIAYTVEIDNVLNATGVPLTSTLTNNGGGTYTQAVGTSLPSRNQFTGLSLGLHKVKITRTTASGLFDLAASTTGIHIITPVHFPEAQSLGPAVEIKHKKADAVPDLGKAKALINFDAIDMTIRGSYNISSFVRVGTGQYVFYFQRPFKDSNYFMAGSARRDGTETGWVADNHQVDVQELKPTFARVSFVYNSGAGSGNDFQGDTRLGTLLFFGELADEESD